MAWTVSTRTRRRRCGWPRAPRIPPHRLDDRVPRGPVDEEQRAAETVDVGQPGDGASPIAATVSSTADRRTSSRVTRTPSPLRSGASQLEHLYAVPLDGDGAGGAPDRGDPIGCDHRSLTRSASPDTQNDSRMATPRSGFSSGRGRGCRAGPRRTGRTSFSTNLTESPSRDGSAVIRLSRTCNMGQRWPPRPAIKSPDRVELSAQSGSSELWCRRRWARAPHDP